MATTFSTQSDNLFAGSPLRPISQGIAAYRDENGDVIEVPYAIDPVKFEVIVYCHNGTRMPLGDFTRKLNDDLKNKNDEVVEEEKSIDDRIQALEDNYNKIDSHLSDLNKFLENRFSEYDEDIEDIKKSVMYVTTSVKSSQDALDVLSTFTFDG